MLTVATLDATDCDYGGHDCADGLTCGLDNCQDYHPGLAAGADCCEPGKVRSVYVGEDLGFVRTRYVVRRIFRVNRAHCVARAGAVLSPQSRGGAAK